MIAPHSTPGRPQDQKLDRVILQIALDHLARHGYNGMTIEGVAAAAGVGKTTIYRRYPHKRALAAAAIASLVSEEEKPPNTGDITEDLVISLRQTERMIIMINCVPIIGSLLVEEQRDPKLLEIFRKQVIHPRREQIINILRRGVQRGVVKKDIDLEIVVDLLFGAFLGRHLEGRPQPVDWIASLVNVVFHGIAEQFNPLPEKYSMR